MYPRSFIEQSINEKKIVPTLKINHKNRILIKAPEYAINDAK